LGSGFLFFAAESLRFSVRFSVHFRCSFREKKEKYVVHQKIMSFIQKLLFFAVGVFIMGEW